MQPICAHHRWPAHSFLRAQVAGDQQKAQSNKASDQGQPQRQQHKQTNAHILGKRSRWAGRAVHDYLGLFLAPRLGACLAPSPLRVVLLMQVDEEIDDRL